MSRSVFASCVLMLACQVAIGEGLPASGTADTKQREVQLQDILVVSLDHCQTLDGGAVLPKNEAPQLKKMAVSVTGIWPNGVLEIEGRSEVLVSDEVWEQSLTGQVRRQALGAGRTVDSKDIAELRIKTCKKNTIRSDQFPADVAPHPVRQVSAQTPISPKVALLQQKQEELAKLQQEIQQLRFETRTSQQILVHVQMLEFSLTKMRKMGVDLPEGSSGYFSGSDLSHILTTVSPGGPRPYTPPKTKANSNDASAVVDWMTGNNIGKIFAEPTIVMLEGRPAQFHVGGEIPMPAKNNSKVVEYQPVGTQIDLLATSLGDDRVRLELKARVSEADDANSVQINGMKCPRINVRQIDTGIVSTFDQPTVLTGMIQQRTEAVRVASGVGEVANRVRGKASTRDVTNEVCLMLVVTPERVDAPETAQRSADPIVPK